MLALAYLSGVIIGAALGFSLCNIIWLLSARKER